MKTVVVDVGGGLRGIYAAGVFDRCLEENIQFYAGMGVSAGSANIASYIYCRPEGQKLSFLYRIFLQERLHELPQFSGKEKLY